MRLVTYREGGQTRVGVLVAGGVCDVRSIIDLPGADDSMVALLSHSDRMSLIAAAQATADATCSIDAVELLAPVLRPAKVIGVGMNYRPFLAQIGEDIPAGLALFHKTASALAGHNAAIVIPDRDIEAVPEGELAVVIGKPAWRVGVHDALDCVGGYTCANDVSARNLEFLTSQWTAGKMLPTFCPLGPAIVTPDEFGAVDGIEVITTVNDVQVQPGSTSQMVFGVAELVSRLSHLVTLEPGDVVLTGTPSDLGAQEPPILLRPGDVVSVAVSGLGVLTNPVTSASDPR